MARSRNRGRLSIPQMLNQFNQQPQISRDDYDLVSQWLLSGELTNPEERYQAIQILDKVKFRQLLLKETD